MVAPRSRIDHKASGPPAARTCRRRSMTGTRNTLVVCDGLAPLGFRHLAVAGAVVAANFAQALTLAEARGSRCVPSATAGATSAVAARKRGAEMAKRSSFDARTLEALVERGALRRTCASPSSRAGRRPRRLPRHAFTDVMITDSASRPTCAVRVERQDAEALNVR